MASASLQVAQRGNAPAGATGARLRAAAMVVYAALLVAWSLQLGLPRQLFLVFGWLWLATVAWHIGAAPRHHLRFLRDWCLPLAALTVYAYSRGLSDGLGVLPHFSMPVTVDTWLGGGTTPTQRLQDAWCGSPCLRYSPPHWYDVLLTTVYLTHFVAGLTLATVLWMRNRVEWIRWMRRYLAISFTALAVYVVYPMAPPWLAARDGYLSPDVHRLTGRGWSELSANHLGMALQTGNEVAAMPSLHAGMAFLIALYGVQRLRSRARWLLLAYPALMSLALVYDGEHYVVDVAAGALLAAAVLLGSQAWELSRGD